MNYPEKLQKIILRDTGIEVTLPESINRGYWSSGVFRWMCKEANGTREFVSEDSMGKCIKNGVHPEPDPPIYWRREWHISRN